jgi:hypothetical protein
MPGMKNTMQEFKKGSLHSGSKKGPQVQSRKQAIAIGLSEQRKAGKKVPPKPAQPTDVSSLPSFQGLNGR